MAGNGPPPSQRKRRRNADLHADAAVTVPSEPAEFGPPLPDEEKYRTQTCVWYRTWRESPQAAAFEATDWQRLHMLAPLVDAYWGEPRKELLSEIRLNESLLGATHVDRLRARITIERPGRAQTQAPATGAGVSDLTARRRRLADGA